LFLLVNNQEQAMQTYTRYLVRFDSTDVKKAILDEHVIIYNSKLFYLFIIALLRRNFAWYSNHKLVVQLWVEQNMAQLLWPRKYFFNHQISRRCLTSRKTHHINCNLKVCFQFLKPPFYAQFSLTVEHVCPNLCFGFVQIEFILKPCLAYWPDRQTFWRILALNPPPQPPGS
jgi:hypothetical protein